MNFLIENWYIIMGFLAIACVCGMCIYQFTLLPTSGQLQKIREWLLYAVLLAEKEFGSKTGQQKLRYTYDLFVTKFIWLAKIIPFETFSHLVDEALDELKNLLGKGVF